MGYQSAVTLSLLLPGAVFCILIAIEMRDGLKPKIVIYGWQLPMPLVFVFVISAGWMLLGLMLFECIKAKPR